jgi:hypothetical protein
MHFNLKRALPFFFLSILYASPSIKQLSEEKYWHILGHYKNNVSDVDSPNFFLAKDGKYSPYKELNATIYYLTHPKYKDDNSTYCRFPARREWIRKKLPNLKIVPQNCKSLNEQLDAIKDIKSVTLVFPTILMNSPASMFGHTLLRLDDKNGDLLNSFAINYAAQTNETNGLIYAFKGLTGGYIGKYAVVPYYKKIAEYNDIKNRDIWEYKLNLTPKEIQRLKLHLFEIKDTWSYYYYFNKNCSYEILWFLEAARPSLNIDYKFNYKTLPIDTIKEAYKEHLISSAYFRPSQKKIILYYFEKIQNKPLALKFIQTYNINLLKNLPTKQKAYILDFATKMLRYEYLSNKIDKKTYLKKYIYLLKKRASLPMEKEIHIKPPKNPAFSHDSNKIWIYAKKNDFLIGFKPAFHNIDDINTGFPAGAYIDFFVTEFSTKELKYFYLFDIKSFTPRDRVFKPISWGVNVGFERFKDNKLYFSLKPSAGVTYKFKTFLYSFNAGVEDYFKNKNYFGGNIGFYLEGNFKKTKTVVDIKRHFFNFKTYNSAKIMEIYSIKRDFSFNIGYQKDINSNFFFAGFSLYFL